MITVGIVGGTGYTGVELIRLVMGHPEMDLQVITSRTDAGMPLAEVFPNFIGASELAFSAPVLSNLEGCELVFFATPNGTAMGMAPDLLARDIRVIDLAADFRLRDQDQWETWYEQSHASPELLTHAIYGLPEMNRDLIQGAQLIANPGCYPTAVILGLLPLLEQGLIDPAHIVADCKSGVSGAGRSARVGTLHAEVSESFKAYGIDGHRHQPEIEQQLRALNQDKSVGLTFVPHLLPMNRGIEATLYVRSVAELSSVPDIYQQRYGSEPFVTVLEPGQHPETRAVRGSNHCQVSVFQLDGGRIVISSVIDNLVKGAAGQAIQNANLMFGLAETQGLEMFGLLP